MWTKEEEEKWALSGRSINARIDQMYNRKPGGLKPAVKLLVDKGWDEGKAKSAVAHIEEAYVLNGSSFEYAELSALSFITEMTDPNRTTIEEMDKMKELMSKLPDFESKTAPRSRRERRAMGRKLKKYVYKRRS